MDKKEKTNHRETPGYLHCYCSINSVGHRFCKNELITRRAFQEKAGSPSNSSTGVQVNQILTKHSLSLHSE